MTQQLLGLMQLAKVKSYRSGALAYVMASSQLVLSPTVVRANGRTYG